MRKIKEVLRQRFGLELQQEQIARSCSIGQATVHRYLERAAAVGLSWPLPDDCDDSHLDALLFPARSNEPQAPVRPGIDFAVITSRSFCRHINKALFTSFRRPRGNSGPSLTIPQNCLACSATRAMNVTAGKHLAAKEISNAHIHNRRR